MNNGTANKIRSSLIRFPPDLTFGYVPNKSSKFRLFIAIISTLKNIIPFIALQKAQTDLWNQNYEGIMELFRTLISLVPYLLILVIIFPLSAAGTRLDKNWENFLAEDFKTFKINFRVSLPMNDKAFDIYNNKMDIINKIVFYISFATFSTGVFIQASFKFAILLVGALLYLIQGFIVATQHDIISRVKIKTIFESKKQLSMTAD